MNKNNTSILKIILVIHRLHIGVGIDRLQAGLGSSARQLLHSNVLGEVAASFDSEDGHRQVDVKAVMDDAQVLVETGLILQPVVLWIEV